MTADAKSSSRKRERTGSAHCNGAGVEEEGCVERLALVARLKPGTEARAEELIARGPPFDLQESGFVRHSVFVSATEVVFVFEAHEVEWLVSALVDDPSGWSSTQLDAWRPLIDGHARIARELSSRGNATSRRQIRLSRPGSAWPTGHDNDQPAAVALARKLGAQPLLSCPRCCPRHPEPSHLQAGSNPAGGIPPVPRTGISRGRLRRAPG
jgi:hypothetical protein